MANLPAIATDIRRATLSDCANLIGEADDVPAFMEALRETSAALEQRIDALVFEMRPGDDKPWLEGHRLKIEESFRGLLMRTWDLSRTARNGTVPADRDRQDFARDLRRAGEEDIELAQAALNLTEGMD